MLASSSGPLSRAAPMVRKFVSPQWAPKVEPPRSASSFFSLNFLPIPKIFRALPVRDVTRTSSPEGYYDISEWHVRSVSTHTLPSASKLHLTNPCAEPKVLSLTKPKGMNRNLSAIILQYHIQSIAACLRKNIPQTKCIISNEFQYFLSTILQRNCLQLLPDLELGLIVLISFLNKNLSVIRFYSLSPWYTKKHLK